MTVLQLPSCMHSILGQTAIIIQVNGKIQKGHKIIGIVEKAKGTSSDTGMHSRAITVLHEQWMCPGMQRHTHITPCSMATIRSLYPSLQTLRRHKLEIRLTDKKSHK